MVSYKLKTPYSKTFILSQDTMEVTQFYLHLPSNASLNKFPNNTLTEYRVCLPQTITLSGDWEVALTETIILTAGIMCKEIFKIDFISVIKN